MSVITDIQNEKETSLQMNNWTFEEVLLGRQQRFEIYQDIRKRPEFYPHFNIRSFREFETLNGEIRIDGLRMVRVMEEDYLRVI